MSIEIQTPETVDRMRRFLGLRGRVPAEADTNIVPVVTVQDLGQPPWRQFQGNSFFSDDGLGAAGAGLFSSAGVVLRNGQVDQSARAVITAVWVHNLTAAARQINIVIAEESVIATATGGATAFGLGCPNLEQLNDLGTLATIPRVPAVTFNRSATNSLNVNGERIALAAFPATVQSVRFELRPIVLRRGWGIAAEVDAANLAVHANFEGTFYPSVSSTQ